MKIRNSLIYRPIRVGFEVLEPVRRTVLHRDDRSEVRRIRKPVFEVRSYRKCVFRVEGVRCAQLSEGVGRVRRREGGGGAR